MLRKAASLAFGLALIVALGFAFLRAKPPKVPHSVGFSTPCEPASPALKAADDSKAVSRIDSTFAAENAGAPDRIARKSRVETVATTIPPPAPQTFPPSLHRPPPADS